MIKHENFFNTFNIYNFVQECQKIILNWTEIWTTANEILIKDFALQPLLWGITEEKRINLKQKTHAKITPLWFRFNQFLCSKWILFALLGVFNGLIIKSTDFWPMFPFYNPWKPQNSKGSLGLPGGAKWEHWPKMDFQTLIVHTFFWTIQIFSCWWFIILLTSSLFYAWKIFV